MNMKEKNRTIALGGVLLALSAASLFLASFVPGIELSLYAFSSFFTAAMIVEAGAKGGWTFYFASALLAFFLIPNKGAALMYAVFFGLYALVKFYIERIRKVPLEILLKLLFFSGAVFVLLYFFKELFLGAVAFPDKYPLWILFAAAALVFLLYDYVFTLIIEFYRRRIRKKV